MRPRKFDPAEVVKLIGEGLKMPAIAKLIGCNATYIYRLLRRDAPGVVMPSARRGPRRWKLQKRRERRAQEALLERREHRRIEEKGKRSVNDRCRCGLLLPCQSCLPPVEETALRGWGQWA